VYQTVFVGDDDRPSRQQVKIWRQCDTGPAKYFGSPWQESRLKAKVSFPGGGTTSVDLAAADPQRPGAQRASQ
jgi:hypothetical protein